MTDQISNDNQPARPRDVREPDAHGQAALFLLESLLHGLVARKVLAVADAVEIVTIAAEVKEAVAVDLGESEATLEKSLSLLGAIHASLRQDLPRD